MVLQWTKELSVGIRRFDREHQIHFDLLNGIDMAIGSGASKEQLLRLFKEFEQFIRFHFMSEENQMIDTQYSGHEAHLAAHTFFLRVFETSLLAFDAEETEAQAVLDKIGDFFLKHVSTEDNMLGRYLTLKMTQ
jgi:hemerythrin